MQSLIPNLITSNLEASRLSPRWRFRKGTNGIRNNQRRPIRQSRFGRHYPNDEFGLLGYQTTLSEFQILIIETPAVCYCSRPSSPCSSIPSGSRTAETLRVSLAFECGAGRRAQRVNHFEIPSTSLIIGPRCQTPSQRPPR